MSIKEHPPQSDSSHESRLHVPVLLDSTLRQLQPKLGENYLDLTAGYGGHAAAILAKTKNYQASVLVDRDQFAISNLHDFAQRGAQLIHSDFVSAARQLIASRQQFNLILADLGVSSPQLDISERGFSFGADGPLDMRMDNRQILTAEQIVNHYKKDDLAQLIKNFGEEPLASARRIAGAIVAARPIKSTKQLAEIIKQQYRGRYSKTHPATRTFQALRIEVNNELAQIEQLLPLLPALLKPGGRVALISFHSLEDRLVKHYFAEQKASGFEAELKILTKKPISGAINDVHNPRSRSAKLRVAEKT